uniref:Uncharacterized protein n=1 Tax=viral metagenome TaxID=1070528 RepID=A0A6C0L4C4_9ZZZZ
MINQDLIMVIRMQNIQLLKYIAYKEEWDYKELCKKYLI